MNYWGDEHMNQQDDATEVNQEDFSWTGGTAIVVGDVDNVDRDPDGNETSNGDILDGFEEMDAARAAFASGDYSGALELFKQMILDEPSSGDAFTAADYLLRCTYYGGLDYSDLREFLVTTAENQGQANPYFSWICRKYAARSLIWSGDLGGASDEFRSILEYAPSEAESLLVEIDLLMLEEEIQSEQTDAFARCENRITELEELFFEALEVGIGDESHVPVSFITVDAFPNPFNSSVRLRFLMVDRTRVNLSIYDASGREVTQLFADDLRPGKHEMVWDASGIASGTYWGLLNSPNANSRFKLILVK